MNWWSQKLVGAQLIYLPSASHDHIKLSNLSPCKNEDTGGHSDSDHFDNLPSRSHQD